MFVCVPGCCIAPCALVLQIVPRYNIAHVPHVAVDKTVNMEHSRTFRNIQRPQS